MRNFIIILILFYSCNSPRQESKDNSVAVSHKMTEQKELNFSLSFLGYFKGKAIFDTYDTTVLFKFENSSKIEEFQVFDSELSPMFVNDNFIIYAKKGSIILDYFSEPDYVIQTDSSKLPMNISCTSNGEKVLYRDQYTATLKLYIRESNEIIDLNIPAVTGYLSNDYILAYNMELNKIEFFDINSYKLLDTFENISGDPIVFSRTGRYISCIYQSENEAQIGIFDIVNKNFKQFEEIKDYNLMSFFNFEENKIIYFDYNNIYDNKELSF